MRNRIRLVVRGIPGWIITSAAWDLLKVGFSLLFGALISSRLPAQIIARVSEVLGSVGLSALDYFLVFILISSALFGALTLLSPPVYWLRTYVLRGDKSYLVQDNEWNVVVASDEVGKVVVGVVTICNKPVRITDNSIAYDVSATLDFFDRKGKRVLQIKDAAWTKTASDKHFLDWDRETGIMAVDFYPNQSWHLPIVYKLEASESLFAYHDSYGLSRIQSLYLGKLPISVTVTLKGENFKSQRPIKYIITPQPGGMPDGFWIQKR